MTCNPVTTSRETRDVTRNIDGLLHFSFKNYSEMSFLSSRFFHIPCHHFNSPLTDRNYIIRVIHFHQDRKTNNDLDFSGFLRLIPFLQISNSRFVTHDQHLSNTVFLS